MRLPGGYPRVALFGITSLLALGIATSRAVDLAAPRPAPPPSAEERKAIAGADGEGHVHAAVAEPAATSAPVPTPDPSPASARVDPTATAPPARASLSAATRADGPASRAIDHGDRTRRQVSLTFDAGADVGYAAEILDTLRRERVVASFGMTGAWAEAHPALVRRMAEEGHHFINHTWSHDSFTGHSTGRSPLTRAQRWTELDRTEEVIQRIAGVSTLPYFRPPYGDLDASVLADVGARGYTITAMWAVDSLGWNGLSAPRIVERCLRLSSPGAILIFHVGSQSQDAAALPEIIRGLRVAGYEFVSVAGLVAP